MPAFPFLFYVLSGQAMRMSTISAVLQEKENRMRRRARLQQEYRATCLSLSLNIPGAAKDSPRIRRLFRAAQRRIEETFSVTVIWASCASGGPHALYAVAEDAVTAKRLACKLEEESEYARLWDVDVYDPEGEAICAPERGQGRSCFLCGERAAVCMRLQNHTPREIQDRVEAMFTALCADESRHISEQAEQCGALAAEAALYEAACCPSPGLVDPMHTGSHKDMDFFTFQRSSAALGHAMARCAEAGLRHEGWPEYLLPVLRRIGTEGESAMLRATNGVNTQKGLLFCMGLAAGAAGLLLRKEKPLTAIAVCETVGSMCKGLTARELEQRQGAHTAGETMYKRFGITGIRGEAETGLPSVRNIGLPLLQESLALGLDVNRALLRTLIGLMCVVDDTTVLNRDPRPEALRRLKAEARTFSVSGLDWGERGNWREKLWQLDKELVQRNVSPGGSADLLAVTWFLHRLCAGDLVPVRALTAPSTE